MSVTLKSTIKPLFLSGTKPNGTAFQNWIDSCLFLIGNDSTTELNTINEKTSGNGVVVGGTRLIGGRISLVAQAPPAIPTVTEKYLFVNSSDSNRLYTKNPSAELRPVTPTQYMSIPFSSAYAYEFNRGILVTKKAIKIKSIRASAQSTAGTQTTDVTILAAPANATYSLSTVAGTQTCSFIDARFSTTSLTLTTVDIPADYIIWCYTENTSATIDCGCLTIEYEEVG